MISLFLMFLNGSIPTGNAIIGEDYKGNLEGKWEIDELYYEYGTTIGKECGYEERNKYTATIKQNNDQLTLSTEGRYEYKPSEFSVDGKIEGNLIEFSGEVGEIDEGIITIISSNLVVSPDCNSFEGKEDFLYQDTEKLGSDEFCEGNFTIKATRKNPVGCQIPETLKGKPVKAEETPTIIKEPTPTQETTRPAPPTNYTPYIIAIGVLILLITLLPIIKILMKRKKGGAAKHLDQIIQEAKTALSVGDREKALTDYKALIQQLTKHQDKLSPEDQQRIYNEGMDIYRAL